MIEKALGLSRLRRLGQCSRDAQSGFADHLDDTLSTNRVDEDRGRGRVEALHEEGTYYSNRTGHLIRIPEAGLKPGFSPVIEVVGRDPMVVTKLSDDPYLCISKARMLAADLDLQVNF